MAKRAQFKFLSGDCDFVTYGGSWVRKVGVGKFHVMKLDNWNEHEDEPELQYNVSLSEIDVAATTDRQMADCLGYSGIQIDDEDLTELHKVESLHAAGARAPLWEGNGNNYRKLMTEARKYSAQLTNDPELYAYKMSEPVNRLGSTAREYQQGDITSAITRGVLKDDPDANLMAKIHGATDQNLKDFKAESRTGVAIHVPQDEDDPLAYVAGSVDAFSGADMRRGPNISPAYTKGYKDTVDQKAR